MKHQIRQKRTRRNWHFEPRLVLLLRINIIYLVCPPPTLPSICRSPPPPLHLVQYISSPIKQISRDGWFLHYCWFLSERPYVSTSGNAILLQSALPPPFSTVCRARTTGPQRQKCISQPETLPSCKLFSLFLAGCMFVIFMARKTSKVALSWRKILTEH